MPVSSGKTAIFTAQSARFYHGSGGLLTFWRERCATIRKDIAPFWMGANCRIRRARMIVQSIDSVRQSLYSGIGFRRYGGIPQLW